MLDVSDLIGVPYLENGRTADGLDCYGLAIEVERRAGKKLNDIAYSYNYAELLDEVLPSLNVKETGEPREGALVVMTIKRELHVGVFLNNRQFIHATRNQGVRISDIKLFNNFKVFEVI